MLPLPLAYCIWLLHPAQWAVLATGMLLAGAYIWPLFGFPLRKIPYAKTFLIAITWMLITYLLPAFPWKEGTWIGALERILACICICLPFDVQDAPDDKARHIKTIPLSIKYTPLMMASLLLLAAACAFMGAKAYPPIFLSLLPVYILLAGLACWPLRRFMQQEIGTFSPYHYVQLMLLDGVVGLQGCVAMLL